jgi:hypothetical protein
VPPGDVLGGERDELLGGVRGVRAVATLMLADLAGSERLNNILESSGDSVFKSLRQKEAIEINKFLAKTFE